MSLTNTHDRYGGVARALHWLTALLILTAIPLGLIASWAPAGADAEMARKMQLFSVHKTVGVAAFFLALARILWALTQVRPAPLHPDRLWETRAAEAVHWTLYISLLAVPLSGWVLHAATEGFAPILWPFGQDLPLVPKSEAVAGAAGAAHWVFTKLLGAAILLHIAGALKHALIDRDGTLARMWRGAPAPAAPRPHRERGPVIAAVALYAAGAGLALALTAPPAEEAGVAAAAPPGMWQVQDGTLEIAVRQMGATVGGRFAVWQAEIALDETVAEGPAGTVRVTVDMASLTLGSVSDQAKGPDFLNVPAHPQALFEAAIRREAAGGYVAEGTLTLAGRTAPLALPFTLAVEGDTAHATGTTVIDRRDFGIGGEFEEAKALGFPVEVAVDVTARRP